MTPEKIPPILLAAAGATTLLAALPTLYAHLATTSHSTLPTLRDKRICLLIAHPDDEAMFFAPAVLALTRPELGNHVKILCLSSGDAEGLGETRKKELGKSGVFLGLGREEDSAVIESPDFPDSMTTTWSTGKISTLLARLFTTRAPHSRVPQATIDVLITFDPSGISGHPNHKSLYHGATSFVSKLSRLATLEGADGSPEEAPVDLYTLTTVGFVRKYSAFLDGLFSLSWFRAFGPGYVEPVVTPEDGSSDSSDELDAPPPKELLFMSPFSSSTPGTPSVSRARAAMTQAHVSQMRWFRWGWITLSRYMYINTLVLSTPAVEPLIDTDTASSFGAPTEIDVPTTDDRGRFRRETPSRTDESELSREKEKYMKKLEQERALERERAVQREKALEEVEKREEEAKKLAEEEAEKEAERERERERAHKEKRRREKEEKKGKKSSRR